MILSLNLRFFPIYVTSCFSTGSTGGAVPKEKRESSKFIVLILLFSVVVTALVFVGLFVCYVYQREKYPFSQRLSLSDKGTSYNSASHLISHNATSLPEFKVYISSPATRNTGTNGISKSLFARCRLDNTVIISYYT